MPPLLITTLYTAKGSNMLETRVSTESPAPDTQSTAMMSVYEFHGCFWHGCRTCHPQRTDVHPTMLDRTMDNVRDLVDKKRIFLQTLGYQVVEMWECSWNALKDSNQDLVDFLTHRDLQPPQEPREAFYGGRTNAIRLYAQVEENGEEIRYDDYTSLYPWGLYHPVLPYRSHDKLTFPLCCTCVEENISKPLLDKTSACHHKDDQLALVGTWCTPELEVAIQEGYTITYIHEVWHSEKRRRELFRSYMDTCLKIKEEASGWPEVCTTPALKQAHIDDYNAQERIHLVASKIKKNPGLRALAKMMLNLMWGKFGQCINKTQVREFTDPQPFVQFLDSDQHDVRYVSSLTENRVEIHYKLRAHDVLPSPNLNIFVAAFTTCHAKLSLYQALDHLGLPAPRW
ncbi:uncharacterized protein [Montipora capricornis]|uniref:uncharacterized protein n=1 Tax=Montipora capricornis TaxID=246305 RepID=UPI0035F20F64